MVFVQKSKFFLLVFFGEIISENIVFEILDKKQRFLDQKNKVLKRSKLGDFPKGIIHGFCSKIILFLIYFFWIKKVDKDHFLMLLIEKNDFYTRKLDC